MHIVFEFKGEKLVSRKLLRLTGNVKDFTPAFTKIADDLRASERDLFDSEGTSSGRPWAPIRQTTIDSKLRRHQDPRILHATGRLERSFTSGAGRVAGSDQIVVITPSSLAFGSSVEYAGAHQLGTDDLAKRRPLDLAERERHRMVERLQQHALAGVR